ncbi:MAG: hypothetical protein HY775_12015 [Acidobacteria bacterium]|nr:hypothetical protein [Acidobacteriota bacterium]
MRQIGTAFAVCFLVVVVGAPAGAKIASPAAGTTVRGDVAIAEDAGGTTPWWCSDAGADSTITVTRKADAQVVLQKSKGGPGAWTAAWVTHGQLIGDYTLKSVATSKNWLCQTGSPETLSEFDVHLENLSALAYAGQTSAALGSVFTAGARLTDQVTGRAIEGRTVTFAMDGRPLGACVTGADGTCSTQAAAVALPGTHTIEASFASDTAWVGSSAQVPFEVTVPGPPPCLDDPPSCLPA